MAASDPPQTAIPHSPDPAAEQRAAAADRATSQRIGLLVGALGSVPVIMRGVALVDAGIEPGQGDLLGLMADGGIVLLAAALIAAVAAGGHRAATRALVLAFAFFWLAVHAANLEHVLTLGTVVNAAHAGFVFDETFFTGSALKLRHPLLIAVLGLLSTGLLWRATSVPRTLRTAGRIGLAGVVVLAVRLVMPESPEATTWRQSHFMLENVRWLSSPAVRTAGVDRIPGLYPGDLDGASNLSLDHRGENVLIVVLEGVSGAYLDRIAEIHGLAGERPRLESLDAVSRQGYTLVNFVNHQRQTNRGLYSLLCGDLPKQFTAAPKMTELGLHSIDANCLPQALRRNGYETAFLQAAPLAFMSKDKFAPRAGFSRVHGTEWFDHASDRGAGGVDDREFLRQSMRLVAELEQDDRPWFLTLLTSGTHHPFMVPESFEGAGDPQSFTRAIDYLDLALAGFLEALEASGIRKDTLVVFTSDESFGLERPDGEQSNDDLMISQAWGVLVALLPAGNRREIDVPHMQTDVAISILDYLGLQHEARSFRGRSFFRTYATSRPIPFANTYMRMAGLVEDDSSLLLCLEDRTSCRRHALERPPLIFAGRREMASPDTRPGADPGITLLAEIAARSEQLAVLPLDVGSRDVAWSLIETPTTVVVDSARIEARAVELRAERAKYGGPPVVFEDLHVPIFGNQYLTLPARHEATVELELAVLGDADVAVRHSMLAVPTRLMPTAEDYRMAAEQTPALHGLGESTLGMRPRFIDRTAQLALTERTISPDVPFRLRYSYSTAEDLDRLNVRLLARHTRHGIAGLVVRKATLELRALDPGEEPVGLVIHDFSHRKLESGSLAAVPASR